MWVLILKRNTAVVSDILRKQFKSFDNLDLVATTIYVLYDAVIWQLKAKLSQLSQMELFMMIWVKLMGVLV